MKISIFKAETKSLYITWASFLNKFTTSPEIMVLKLVMTELLIYQIHSNFMHMFFRIFLTSKFSDINYEFGKFSKHLKLIIFSYVT